MSHGEPSSVTPVTGARSAPAERDGALPPRVIQRRTGLPGTRAVVGGLLMAVAAVGVFLAYADATEGPSEPVVIATRAIRVGEELESDDLRVVTADLPGASTGSFDEVAALVGRVALGPIGAGEIVQAAAVTDDRARADSHEIALTLPRAQVAVGRLKQGERVDVFVTRDDRTASVVRGAQVVQIGSTGDGSLTSERELSIVVAVPTADGVAALVHALRTGDVTVVRATFADVTDTEPVAVEGETAVEPEADDESDGSGGAGG